MRDEEMASSSDIATLIGRLLASFTWKTMWLHEEPYTIWQLPSPVVASSILSRYDAMRQLRPAVARPHRVTELLVGAGPASLRADMEDHARGQPMSPALWEEVLSYSLAKIDETWVEAAHRDLSSHNKRAPASNLPFASASQRVGSILAS